MLKLYSSSRIVSLSFVYHAVLVSMRDLEMTGSYESGLLLFVAEMSKHLKGTNMFPGTVLSVVSLSV